MEENGTAKRRRKDRRALSSNDKVVCKKTTADKMTKLTF
jgi:hypothetical protein